MFIRIVQAEPAEVQANRSRTSRKRLSGPSHGVQGAVRAMRFISI